MPHEPRRAYPILRGKAHRRGQVQEGDHSLPQEIHCPRDLPGPLLPILTQTLDFGALTNIEASPGCEILGTSGVWHSRKFACFGFSDIAPVRYLCSVHVPYRTAALGREDRG